MEHVVKKTRMGTYKISLLLKMIPFFAYDELQRAGYCVAEMSHPSCFLRGYCIFFNANIMAADRKKAKIRMLSSRNFLYLLSFHQSYYLRKNIFIGIV